MSSKDDQKQDSQKRVAFQVRLFEEPPQSEDMLPTEIHVVPTGEWDHPLYGEMKINEDDIAQFVENFRAGIRKPKIPVTAGHSVMEELPAIGWFTDLMDRGKEGLWATVEWTKQGKDLLLQGAFKYFSPEYIPVYEDPATLRKYKYVLTGGALTNHPFFRELKDVVSFSEPQIITHSITNMTIEEILAKSAEERTEEEVAFLEENKDDLTDEQKAQLDGEAGAGDGDDAGDEGGDAGEDGDGNGEGAEGEEGADSDEVTATAPKDGVVQMSAAEHKALVDKANKGAQAFAALEKANVKESVRKLTFSATNPDGRLLPKQEKAATEFLMSLDQKQRDQFTNIINNMPKLAFSDEQGDGGESETSAAAEVERAVNAKITASEGKLSYADALKQVFSEKPDLEKRYNEEHPST